MNGAGPKRSRASRASEHAARAAPPLQPTVLFAKDRAVAWLTLNRPEVFNAYNMAMRDELHEGLWAVHHDPEIGAMVLAGAGAAFSTGGDLSEFGQAPSPIVARWVRFRRDVWHLLRTLPVASIAALHGYTVGGGLEMALLCDFAIATPDTRICLPETGVGMIPGVAGTQTAPRRLGMGWALDLALTGRWIDAKQAKQIGLIAEIVPAARLAHTAQTLAEQLSKIPRGLTALTKTAVWEGLNLPLEHGLHLERRLAARLAR
jgi:enoyl-CoA hydratase/carnithine racemase